MKKLHFDYCMEIRYSADVSWCCYTIKCIPKDSDRQKISNIKIDMIPETKAEWATDSHGNRYIYGSNEIPHSYFKYHIKGDAECGCATHESVATETEEMIYRHSHGLTVPGERLREYLESIRADMPSFDEKKPLDKAKHIMEKLHEYLVYEKGCTGIDTGAEEAFSIGRGVCQDYSHIMISLLNMSGCSARYVTGLIIGEGESHAWVEVVDDGKWYGLDPTPGYCRVRVITRYFGASIISLKRKNAPFSKQRHKEPCISSKTRCHMQGSFRLQRRFMMPRQYRSASFEF